MWAGVAECRAARNSGGEGSGGLCAVRNSGDDGRTRLRLGTSTFALKVIASGVVMAAEARRRHARAWGRQVVARWARFEDACRRSGKGH